MKLSLAILLVALITGAFGLNAISRNVPYNGTFSITILPGKYHYLPLYIVGEGRLSFDFLETRSQLVSFYFLTEQQYDSYKSTGITAGLYSITNVASWTYATPIPATGNFYLILAHGTGFDQTSEQVTLNIRLDGTNSLYLGLEGITFVAIVALPVYYFLRKRENGRRILSFLKDNPNYGFGKDEDDARILTITRELCRDLRLKFDPHTLYYVVWVKFGGIRAAPSDQCLMGEKGARRGWVHLPAVLRGRLTPSEWKPLIASSLICSFDPRFRRKYRFRFLVIPLTALAILVADVVLYRLFYGEFSVASSATERFLLLQFPILLFPIGFLIVFAVRKWNMSLRKNFLKADELAASILGKEQLLQTLTKIDSMGLSDIEQRKKDKSTVWTVSGSLPWPNITQRIQRVQNLR